MGFLGRFTFDGGPLLLSCTSSVVWKGAPPQLVPVVSVLKTISREGRIPYRSFYGGITVRLGTLPALALFPTVSRSFLRPLGDRAPRVAAMLLVVAGVGSLMVRMHHATWSEEKSSLSETLHSCGHRFSGSGP